MKICTLQPIKVAQALTQKKGNWKSFLSLVVLLVAVTFAAKANPVDLNAARQVGAKFINANAPTRSEATSLEHVITYSTSDGTPAFYVFNTENNYVIVAANDCATPILGYSTTGQFDPSNLPVQLQDYLQGFVNEIQYAYDRHMIGNATTAQQWSMVRTTGRLNLNRDNRSVAPLLTDSWGQGCWYNDHCPTNSNGYCGHVLTGCVATSMSEIMRYWGHPAQGFGSHSYTPSGYPTQTVNFSGTTYDWANMPNSLSANSTDAQVEAVSTLIWHCGVAVNMSYGINGSAASNSAPLNAYLCYFDYSSDLHGEFRDDYDDATWLNMIKTCLDLQRPIHYFGSNGEGGHAFVCDGYDSNDLLHFNFGWNGTSNDYFAVNAILGENGYVNNNFAIFDIHPSNDDLSYLFLGVGDLSGYSPFLPSYNSYSLSEQIYTADEIGYSGTINSIALYCMVNSGCTRNYDLYLTTTDKSVFSSGTDWVPVSVDDLVFSGSVTFSPNQWTTITLDRPFDYNIGAGNLVLVTDNNSGSSATVGTSSFSYNMTKQAIYASSSSTNYIPTNVSSYSGSITPQKSEIRLGITLSNDSTTYYQVATSIHPIDGGTVSGSGYYAEGSTCTLTATPDTDYSFVNWTKDGTVVSTDASYTFTVTESADYVARFKAQSSFVYIGDGGQLTAQMLPTNSYYNYSLSQQIFTVAEIGGSSNIYSVSFKNIQNEQTRTLEVYMVHTDKTYYDNTNDWIAVSEADKVFSGTVTFETGAWSTITFDTPFAYNGTDNVALVINDITGTYNSTMECLVFVTSLYQSPSIYAYRDNNIYDVTDTTLTGSFAYGKNQVRFGVDESDTQELTVYDGTSTNNKVPAYMYYFDAYTRAQHVIPAADLFDMIDADIQSIKWYSSLNEAYTTGAEVIVYLAEVDNTNISAFEDTGNCETVYQGLLTVGANGICTINFNTPYHYNGGNLLIGCENLNASGWKNVNWYGQTVTGAAVYGNNSSSLSAVTPTVQNFIPKTTFSYSVGGNETLESNLDYTTYDWQTNSGAITRTITWPDGKVSFAYTMASDASYSDRGTGIGTYDSNTDEWIPSGGHVESEKTGFGSIARYGNNSIVVAAHTASRCGVYLVQDKDNIYPGCAALLSYLDSSQSPCWPNVMTSGSNRNIIHVIATSSANNKLYYYRSSNGGLSWDKQNVILPYLTEEYGSVWGSNVAYWMETTEDNCLALVVNNGWSDGMVIYSYDNGETWQRKVFYHHPGINTSFENWFLFPRWTSAQWGPDGELRLAYEFNGKSGEPGSSIYYHDIGGVAFWSESLPYHGETAPEWGSDPTNPMPMAPGQPFIMDSAYIFRDIYSSWWFWSNASHDMWPEYFGYLPTLDDNGNWEDPYESTSFNIADRSLHGWYNNGCVGMPVLCAVPGTNALVAVWCAMDENHTDVYGNYYLKLFASYSNDGGHNWSNMVHLTKDAVYNNMECVYPQATIVDNKLVVACQMDGVAGTFVQSDDDDPSDNHYQGMAFNLEDLFGAIGNDDIVTIGSGTDSQFQLPVQSDWLYSLSEQIYTAEEIGRAGRISTIGFKYDYDQPFNVQASFALKHVTKEFFEASNDMVNLSDDDFVYSGTFSATAPGWVTLVLDTPFEYDGTSNLLVACYKTEEITYGSNYKFKCTYYEDGSRALGYYNSSIIPDYTDLAGYGGWKQPYNYRNDIQLGFGEVPIVLSAPQAWIDFDYMLEYEENYLNWNMPNEDVLLYNIYQDDILVASTTDTYYDLTNLTYNLDGYRFNVTAVYAEGESYYSNSVYVYVTGKGTIAGHVYEQDGVTPIQGAMVRFDGTSELGGGYWYFWYPNEEAFYSIDMPVGVYTGYAIAPGYQQTYYVGDIVISHNETTTINFSMEELFDPIAQINTEYYPDATNVSSEAVKVSWSMDFDASNWLYYDDGVFSSSVGTNGGSFYWGVRFDVSEFTNHKLTDVSLFDYTLHTGSILIYQGGETAPETLVYSQAYSCTGSYDFVTFMLNRSVNIDPSQSLWIVMRNNNGNYPASGCADTGNPNSHWISLDGTTWTDVTSYGLYYSWMLRGYVTSGEGTATLAQEMPIQNIEFATNSNPAQLSAINIDKPYNAGTPATTGNRSFQYYRLYRTDASNNGPYNIENTVLVADNVTDTYYIDASWAEAEEGLYKYGVSCVYEGNRESRIQWGEGSNGNDMASGIAYANSDADWCGIHTHTEGGNRSPWDLMMSFNAAEGGHYGLVHDGTNFYTSNWGNSSCAYNFYKYDLQGNIIEGFNISDCGTLRGMTFDGDYVYGVANSNTIYCVNLSSHTLVSSFTSDYGAMRGITYDPVREGFWVIGNWSGYLTLIDRTGAIQFTGPMPTSASDLAYYMDENGIEHVFCFNNGDNGVYDYNITTNTLGSTAVFSFNNLPGATGTSGGCNVGNFNGKIAFMGDIQQNPNLIGIYELKDGIPNVQGQRESAIRWSSPIEKGAEPIDDGFHWEVNENIYPNTMSVIAIVQIDGVEQFRTDLEVGVFCGDECRGTQRPSDEYYDPSFMPHYFMFTTIHGNDNDELTFRVYDHSLNQELDLQCLSSSVFETNGTIGDPGNPFPINFSSGISQSSDFAQGWNWWSSYVVADDLMAQLKNGLGNNGQQIKSQTKFSMNYGSMWMGQLNSIENDQTYMIQANAACSVDVTGFAVDPADHPITLNTGWKWIGFPSAETLTVTEALAGITPTAGDQIKAQNSFSTYYNNIGWMGTLKNLTPGKGYMFKLNGASQTLVFPSGSRATVVEENIIADGNHWVPDVYAYPSNMTVMAVVELDDVELASENYELAAFANGEVRGSTRLMYVEGLNRWMAFLTIAGDEATELRFGLYDGLTDTECFDSGDVLVYAADAIVGSPDEPMVVRFRGTVGLADLESSLHVYPNPAACNERFNVSLPVDSKVRVEIVNALGAVVHSENSAKAPVSVTAPAAAGVYTLRITVEGKGTYCRKLIVE